MKVGDIVQPSARVLGAKGFYWLNKESVGLVVRQPLTTYGTWQVQWYGGGSVGKTTGLSKNRIWNMRREWIKHAKVRK